MARGIGDIIKDDLNGIPSTKEELQGAILKQMQQTEQFREQGGNVTYGVVCTDLHSGLTGLTRNGAIEAALRMNLDAVGTDSRCLYIPMAFIDSSKSSRG